MGFRSHVVTQDQCWGYCCAHKGTAFALGNLQFMCGQVCVYWTQGLTPSSSRWDQKEGLSPYCQELAVMPLTVRMVFVELSQM